MNTDGMTWGYDGWGPRPAPPAPPAPTPEVVGSIEALLAYNWYDEERDRDQQQAMGEYVEGTHVFDSIERIHTWLHLKPEASTLDRIVSIMSGNEWNADSMQRVADVLRSAGYEIADVEEVA